MNLHDELGLVIFNEHVHDTVQYLCDRGLLATDKTCSKCQKTALLEATTSMKSHGLYTQ